MALKLISASFEDSSLGAQSTSTPDGQVLSILFERLSAESQASDKDLQPQIGRAEGVVRSEGQGSVTVQVRGSSEVAGSHGYGHVMGWANGQRLHVNTDEFGNFVGVCTSLVKREGLRISLLLLAQRDLAHENSAAACWIDTIDLLVDS